MRTQEITITTPNEVGTMGKVFGLVSKAGVNVKSFIAYSMGNQGTFKLITADNAKVGKLAEEAGYTVEMTDVAVVTCTDAIGTGADLGQKLGDAGVNIDYAYATGVGGGEAVVVFAVDDVNKAVKALG